MSDVSWIRAIYGLEWGEVPFEPEIRLNKKTESASLFVIVETRLRRHRHRNSGGHPCHLESVPVRMTHGVCPSDPLEVWPTSLD